MQVGIQITKSVSFRGVDQEFHNTYNFKLNTAVTAPSENLVDDLVAKERKLHASSVSYKRAAVWSSGGTQAQNQMLFQKNLTGAGTGTASADMDRERALLVRCPAGFDSRGRPVYLRKYFHVCGNVTGTSIDVSGIKANTQQIGTTDRTAIGNLAQDFKQIGTTDFWQICAKSGREPTGNFQCHAYLEHHQLGDQWR